jgi:hypothetical protein
MAAVAAAAAAGIGTGQDSRAPAWQNGQARGLGLQPLSIGESCGPDVETFMWLQVRLRAVCGRADSDLAELRLPCQCQCQLSPAPPLRRAQPDAVAAVA